MIAVSWDTDTLFTAFQAQEIAIKIFATITDRL